MFQGKAWAIGPSGRLFELSGQNFGESLGGVKKQLPRHTARLQLPFHSSFFCRVDLSLLSHRQRLVKEKAFDIVEEEVLRVGIR